MSTAQIITLAASACALLITAMLLMGTVLGGSLKEPTRRCFFAFQLCNLVGSACEIATALLAGTPGRGIALSYQLIDFVNYASGSILFIFFALYLYEYLSLQVPISKKPTYLVICFSAANILLMAAAQGLQLFARLDEINYSHPTGALWVTQLFSMLSMLVLVMLTLQNVKRLQRRVWVSLLCYLGIQVACYIIEDLFPGVWVSYLGSAIATFLIYINLQVDLKQQMKEQDLALSESKISIMLSQIQPHFLYNSLSAIANLCDTAPGEVKEAVTDFAHYLRGNLESLTQRKLIYFSDELEHVETYLALERLRYQERLQVQYDITVEGFILPPLTLQPIVENAVQHGLMEKGEGGMVSIRTALVEDAVHIVVTDNGIGFDPEADKADGHIHTGIDNVRGRLAALCHGTLDIQSEIGMGTTVTIAIPYTRGEGIA